MRCSTLSYRHAADSRSHGVGPLARATSCLLPCLARLGRPHPATSVPHRRPGIPPRSRKHWHGLSILHSILHCRSCNPARRSAGRVYRVLHALAVLHALPPHVRHCQRAAHPLHTPARTRVRSRASLSVGLVPTFLNSLLIQPRFVTYFLSSAGLMSCACRKSLSARPRGD